MTTDTPVPLPVEKLRQRCAPAALEGIGSRPEGSDGRSVIFGQERALPAMKLAVQSRHSDFNLFVLGAPGTGRHSAVKEVLRVEAGDRAGPWDWVYVNNFDDPYRPAAMRLPAGTAIRLRDEMQRVVDDLGNDIPALFQSEEYQTQTRSIGAEYAERHEAAMADFSERAHAEDLGLVRTPMGFMVAALRDGEVLKTEEFEKLPAEERQAIDEKITRFQDELAEILSEAPRLEREQRARVEALNAEMAERAVSARISDAETAFEDCEAILSYLARAREDMIANPELFLQAALRQNDSPFPEGVRKLHREPAFRRYMVNVMVARDESAPHVPPIETEDLPTLDRLVGHIEHISQMGSLVTDFTLIRPGALHRANGGFLILDARRILAEPYAWDALKRSLKKQAIAITSLAERMSLVSTTSLEPDSIPLDVRVVLIGDRVLHALLVTLDPDFGELFKIQAEFEDSVDRTDGALVQLADVVRSYAAKEGLLDVALTGLARLLDEATRIADDGKKLSLRIGELADIFREAEHYARERRADAVEADDIDRAVTERDRRSSRIRDRTFEMLERRTILVDTDGEKVGQINGLSVLGLGGYRFGRPSRITARTRMGSGKLVDIEREVELGGPLHSKGVMILAGYLTATYALDVPFSLYASLVFEQSYGGVDGDSASCAELVALLSSLADAPIRQNLAVTGSINQLGEIQAIGGVNEKIEGFFDVCNARGLTGDQGVLIPATNVEHLMLRDRVVEAVEARQFRIVPITRVDDAIGLLCGLPAGERGSDGRFPDGTVNARVETQLRAFAEARRTFAARDPNGATDTK